MRTVEVLMDMKDGSTLSIKAMLDESLVEKVLAGQVDHISIRAELPPKEPNMKHVTGFWLPYSGRPA